MATKDGKFTRGAIDKMVYREYRGMQVIQAKPVGERFRLTEATKKAASLFGVASNLASHFRYNMWDTIGDLQDGTMVSRFNAEVLFAIRQAHDPT